MKIDMKKERTIIILIVILILFLLIFQINKCKNNLKKADNIKDEIVQLKELNKSLELNYHKSINSRNLIKNKNLENDFETLILSKLEKFNLDMIDFSSSEAELNLNLSGNFHSILYFIQYLELNLTQFKIANFKIKTNNNNLFFFIKIEKELI